MKGEWIGGIPDLGDIELRVRRIGNVDYRRRRSEMLRDSGAEDLPRLYAETILTDWKNVSIGRVEQQFSREGAIRLLSDPAMATFFEGVRWAAQTITAHRTSALKDDCDALVASKEWNLQWADQVEWLEACAAEDPDFNPPALQGRPTLPDHLAMAWEAFADLSSERQSGFSVGQVPWTAIMAYADHLGIEDPDERDDFKTLINALDGAVLKHHDTQSKKAAEQAGRKPRQN